jgi:Family of unknown function (DUF5317)
MFIAFITLVILASAALTGGRFSRFAQVKIRYSWLIMASLVVQILITTVVPGAPKALLVALHLATYVVAGAAIWVNRALPGLVIIGVGALLNGVTIALNGGTLPASARAVAEAGFPVDSKNFENSGVLPHPMLKWLGDIVATPSWLPFRNVISIGDIVILLGATILIHGVTQTVPARAVTGWFAGRRSRGEVANSYA